MVHYISLWPLPLIYNKFSTEAVSPFLIVLMPGVQNDKLQDFSEAKLIMSDIYRAFKVISNGTLILPVTAFGDLLWIFNLGDITVQ